METNELVIALGVAGVLGYMGYKNGWFGTAAPVVVTAPSSGTSIAPTGVITTPTPAPAPAPPPPVAAPPALRTAPNAADIAAMTLIPDATWKATVAQKLINYGINPQIASGQQMTDVYYGRVPVADVGTRLT